MNDMVIAALEEQWRVAELAGDQVALGELAAEGFRLVGPLGFVLDREAWLSRYADDDTLVTSGLTWHDAEVQRFGDTAVSVGLHEQAASYRGHPADGTFRSTHVWVHHSGRWQLAGIQLSAVAPEAMTP